MRRNCTGAGVRTFVPHLRAAARSSAYLTTGAIVPRRICRDCALAHRQAGSGNGAFSAGGAPVREADRSDHGGTGEAAANESLRQSEDIDGGAEEEGAER